MGTTIRFSTFPRTQPPPRFTKDVVGVFRSHENNIGTLIRPKGLSSDSVLKEIQSDLCKIGFNVEKGKNSTNKISRPVFFGENGIPTLHYEIDSFHPEWKCGLEVEAGRAWLGNAIYRDLVQALVMVDLEYLVLAVPNAYRRKSLGRNVVSKDYDSTCSVADAVFGHSRFVMPYRLIVIGY